MLEITIPSAELFDEESSSFFTREGVTLRLEHSLVSLSKWEELWEKPFLDGTEKTNEETDSYILCMSLEDLPDPTVIKYLSRNEIQRIADYINEKRTATWFTPDPNQRPSTDIITSEVIYYWMTAHSIPFEAEHWYFNRLITLIKVCNEKNKPAKKSTMPNKDQMSARRALAEKRRLEFKTD